MGLPGFPEIIVISGILFLFFIPRILRKFFPNVLLIGLGSCLLLGFVGQFYLPGGAKYAFMLLGVFVVLSIYDPEFSAGTTNIASVIVMYFRFKNVERVAAR